MSAERIKYLVEAIGINEKRISDLKFLDGYLRHETGVVNVRYHIEGTGWKEYPVIGNPQGAIHDRGTKRSMEMVQLGLLKWCRGEMTQAEAKIKDLKTQLAGLLL